MCMIDDSDGWKIYREAMRRAAKDHRCGECRRTIAKGERYQYVTGLSYGYGTWSTFRTCEQCCQAKRWLLKACEGYLFEMVQEDLFEHITGDESYLRTAPLTRLGRWMLADWRDRAGQLRPVEAVREVTDQAIAAYRRQHDEATAA